LGWKGFLSWGFGKGKQRGELKRVNIFFSFFFSLSFSFSHNTQKLKKRTRVDVLDRHLEAVERPRLGDLHLVHEARAQILQNDAVGRCEEGEDVRDEVALVVGELLPVGEVVGEVDFLGLWGGGWRIGRREEKERERERGEGGKKRE
jgi:hypothetical protein